MDKKNIVVLTCFNPSCTNTIMTTADQVRDFFETMPLKYGIRVLPTCSKECAEKLLKEKGEYQDINEKAEKARQKMRDAR